MTNRLVNIDLIKFLSIIIMVVDHMILISHIQTELLQQLKIIMLQIIIM